MSDRARVGLAQAAVVLGLLLLAIAVPLASRHGDGPAEIRPATPAEVLCHSIHREWQRVRPEMTGNPCGKPVTASHS